MGCLLPAIMIWLGVLRDTRGQTNLDWGTWTGPGPFPATAPTSLGTYSNGSTILVTPTAPTAQVYSNSAATNVVGVTFNQPGVGQYVHFGNSVADSSWSAVIDLSNYSVNSQTVFGFANLGAGLGGGIQSANIVFRDATLSALSLAGASFLGSFTHQWNGFTFDDPASFNQGTNLWTYAPNGLNTEGASAIFFLSNVPTNAASILFTVNNPSNLSGYLFDSIFFVAATPTVAASSGATGRGGGGGGGASVPTLYVTDLGAIDSALLSSAPMAYAQGVGALSASSATLRDLNGRIFRHRARAADRGMSPPKPDGKGVSLIGEKNPNFPGQKEVGLMLQDTRWEFWVAGDYNGLGMDDSLEFAGFQQDTVAGTVGAEYQLSPSWVLGLGFSHLESDGDGSQGIGGFDLDGITLSGYLSYVSGPWYADLLYGASLFDHEVDRRAGFGRHARADADSTVHAVDFHTGWNVTRGSLVTGPLLGTRYAHVSVDGYSETGAGTFDTRVGVQSLDSMVGQAGWQTSYRIPTKWGAIVPQVRASWEREFLDGNDPVKVGLLNSPYSVIRGSSVSSLGGFNAQVRPPSRESDYLAVGAGCMIEIDERWRVLVDYEGHYFAEGYTENWASMRVGISF